MNSAPDSITGDGTELVTNDSAATDFRCRTGFRSLREKEGHMLSALRDDYKQNPSLFNVENYVAARLSNVATALILSPDGPESSMPKSAGAHVQNGHLYLLDPPKCQLVPDPHSTRKSDHLPGAVIWDVKFKRDLTTDVDVITRKDTSTLEDPRE